MKKFLKLTGLLFLLTACQHTIMPMAGTSATDSFPDTWWAPVPAQQLASWEISPDQASREKGEVILSKRNELGQLSNFAATAFVLDGDSYASIEGLWQSMKFPEGPHDERVKDSKITWTMTRQQVAQMTAFEAKRAGDVAAENMKKMGIKWITYKGKKLDYTGADQLAHYDIIFRASRAKLEAHPQIKNLLLSTRSLILKPDHATKADAPPAYKYFDIYMKLRAEYQAALVK